jgi:hypothetical protein
MAANRPDAGEASQPARLNEQARRLEAAYWHIPTTATDDAGLPMRHVIRTAAEELRQIAKQVGEAHGEASPVVPSGAPPTPPHVREDYREVWLSGWRAGFEHGQTGRLPSWAQPLPAPPASGATTTDREENS